MYIVFIIIATDGCVCIQWDSQLKWVGVWIIQTYNVSEEISKKDWRTRYKGEIHWFAEITQSTVSLLIHNGIHPKYNIISSQWERVCDLALLTCLHKWSLESKTKAISEKAPLYYVEIWTGVLYHVNETYIWVAFSSQRISILTLIER